MGANIADIAAWNCTRVYRVHAAFAMPAGLLFLFAFGRYPSKNRAHGWLRSAARTVPSVA